MLQPTLINELADRIRRDVLDLVRTGQVPANVQAFAQLHDWCDANTLGDADTLFGEICTESDTDAEHQQKLDAFTAIHLPAIEAVNRWIVSGGIDRDLQGGL